MARNRYFLFAAVVAACSAGPTLAADMPVKAPPLQAEPFGWDGLYVGINAGYGWGTADSSDGTIGGHPIASLSPRGGFAGIQAGYNTLLTPHWLLGTEFDFDWGHLDGSGLAARSGRAVPMPTAISVRYFGTARERLGYVMDRSLIYVTAGTAWAQGAWSSNLPGVSSSIGDDHVGWTVGAGYEYAFAPRWSAKLEYLYANLGQWKVSTNFSDPDRTIDLKLSTIKLGINYRLDDGQAAAAMPAMPVKAPPAPFSWAGTYVGAHVGYGWGTYDAINTVFIGPTDTIALRPHGVLGGFQGGYNWLVTPAVLVGIESDFDFGSLTANGISTGNALATSVRIDRFATVRGRAGFVAGRTLLYATAGFAYVRERGSESAAAMMTKFYDLGWTAGGGVEYMFAPRWSAKLEYLYARLDSTLSDTAGFDVATRPTVNTVRAGINYKFDWSDVFGAR